MFVSNEDYSFEAWLNDLVNIIKQRAWLDKKENAFLVFQENATFFINLYEEGMKPMEAFNLYEEE